jgi:hypothetical protein
MPCAVSYTLKGLSAIPVERDFKAPGREEIIAFREAYAVDNPSLLPTLAYLF